MEGSKSEGDPNPRFGPNHTDKRIRFCDKILCKVLRYSSVESLSSGHTAIVHHGANEDSPLFLKFLHGHMVSRVN